MVLGVIPARYGSTRFPGKVLAQVNGMPLVELVWRQARGAKRLGCLLVATDDQRVFQVVKGFGGEVRMTSPTLSSGTDRVWEVAKGTDASIILNIQGDEPLFPPEMVDRLVEELEQDPQLEMATLKFRMTDPSGYQDPNLVKVVTDGQGWALYFSRSPLPGRRDFHAPVPVWYKHIGIYAYRRQLLKRFVQWPLSPLEEAERLEQLRALEHGVRIKVLESFQDTVGVDTPEDLKRVERLLKRGRVDRMPFS